MNNGTLPSQFSMCGPGFEGKLSGLVGVRDEKIKKACVHTRNFCFKSLCTLMPCHLPVYSLGVPFTFTSVCSLILRFEQWANLKCQFRSSNEVDSDKACGWIKL